MLNVRSKGKNGELAFSMLMRQELGVTLSRNLDQVRSGGYDLWADGFPFVVEVKRQEQLKLDVWWEQAIEGAKKAKTDENSPYPYPCLAYRRNRTPWRVVVPLAAISYDYEHQSLWVRAELEVDGFVLVARDLMARCGPSDFYRSTENGY